MNTTQFQAIIDGVTKKKDSTLSVKLGTQELSPEDTAKIFEFGNKMIWVAFCENELTEQDLDIPEVAVEFKKDKSPSERLRAVLYVYWEKNQSKLGKSWENWYRDYMDRIISNIKEKLD